MALDPNYDHLIHLAKEAGYSEIEAKQKVDAWREANGIKADKVLSDRLRQEMIANKDKPKHWYFR